MIIFINHSHFQFKTKSYACEYFSFLFNFVKFILPLLKSNFMAFTTALYRKKNIFIALDKEGKKCELGNYKTISDFTFFCRVSIHHQASERFMPLRTSFPDESPFDNNYINMKSLLNQQTSFFWVSTHPPPHPLSFPTKIWQIKKMHFEKKFIKP